MKLVRMSFQRQTELLAWVASGADESGTPDILRLISKEVNRHIYIHLI